jgi:hypothetical protein
MRMAFRILGTTAAVAIVASVGLAAGAADPFEIAVLDEDTGRGVPLVELTTTNGVRYCTDSAGVVAFHEPGLMGTRVHFLVRSHGYTYPADRFGYAGVALDVVAGGRAEVKVRRVNVAERLYRVTGQGIYRDTQLLGRTPPVPDAGINGLVMGQDSVQSAVYRGTLRWFWGDTIKPDYPLGNFHMSGATSRLPGAGGLDPDLGVALDYFVDARGFSRRMAPRPEPGPVWLDGLVVLPDDGGKERLFAAYARVTPQMEPLERGFMQWNDETEEFEKIGEIALDAPLKPGGHPFIHAGHDGRHVHFPLPFPHVRVAADTAAVLDVDRYETYSCFRAGSEPEAARIDRDETGEVRYAWRRGVPPLEPARQEALLRDGVLAADEALVLLRDVDRGTPVVPHNGSVFFNEHRGRWISIRSELRGTSMLGEIWYAEADTPVGPWVYARKIVTHDRYSFYNPRQHPVFDHDGGRIVYFEGTYTDFISGAPEKTPRYDYNQIMYRLDLDDPRLVLPVPVYAVDDGVDGADGLLRTHADLPSERQRRRIPFFAADRPAPGLVPIHEVRAPDGRMELRVGPEPSGPPRFYALPADMADPPATAVPLEIIRDVAGGPPRYVVGARADDAVPARTTLCLVWSSPTRLRWETP